MNLRDFLREPEKIREDLARQKETLFALHSAQEDDEAENSSLQLNALGADEDNPAELELAVLRDPQKKRVLENYIAGDGRKRNEIFEENQLQLYSIVFALYRPGPAFTARHGLAESALSAAIVPGGATWRQQLPKLGFLPLAGPESRSWQNVANALARLARQTVRLDRQDGSQVGSGFWLADETLLTAWHVVDDDGYLLGHPPNPAATPGWIRCNQVNTRNPPEAKLTVQGYRRAEEIDLAVLQAAGTWLEALKAAGLSGEFGAPPGLTLGQTKISPADLAARPVAVIGHPLAGNEGGSSAEISTVFGDAALGTKRFLPGLLHPETPLLGEGDQARLQHDCSTLGGASGACLLDLTTGKVLGLHVAGDKFLRNWAIPSWIIAEKLAQLASA